MQFNVLIKYYAGTQQIDFLREFSGFWVRKNRKIEIKEKNKKNTFT